MPGRMLRASSLHPSYLLAFIAIIGMFATVACGAQEAEQTEFFTLDNGMQVLVVPDHRAPVAAHMVWYRLGAADELPGKSGIAHFLEHLMFKGTDSVPAGEFSKIIARNGGRDNAFTSLDYTGYFQTVATDRLELVMQLESDRMANLSLTDDVVLPERDVILEERRSRIDNSPRALFNEQFMAAQYLAHPYGIPVIGWAHEIMELTREDAVEFYNTYYAPNNAILVVVGDVTVDAIRAMANKYYGALPSRPIKKISRVSEPPQLAARRLIMKDPRVREPSWSRTYLAPSYLAGEARHAPGLEVLADILGGGTTSRLYRALVVEQKIGAGVGAWYQGGNRDLTRFGLYGVPGPGGDINALESAADGVLERLLAEGVSAEEVERAKLNLIAASVYASDGLLSKAQRYGASLAIGLPVEHVETWPDKIRGVTVEEVNAAARAVLKIHTSVSGFLLPELPNNARESGS